LKFDISFHSLVCSPNQLRYTKRIPFS